MERLKSMSRLKKGCLIAAAVVVGIVVVFLWVAVYAGSQDAGYDAGYDTGHSEGYDSGYPEGYNIGHAKGYDTGYAEGYDAGYEAVSQAGKVFRNPTYQEMKDFLKRDKTDQHIYAGAYDCENFASDVCNNAEAEGIRAAVVFLGFENAGGGHVIVAFETTDKGLIFIEPQEDSEVMVEVGIRYLASFGGDIIKRFVICW